MKSNNITQFIVIYLFFLLSLIIGYFINEDFAGGARPDYELHKLAAKYFIDDFKFALLNYDKLGNLHSPIFIIIVSFFIETNEQYGRILYLLISSLIPFIFYLVLKTKYKSNLLILFLLSNFLLLSPYYRATSIWPGDETISLIFFCFSILFYLKYKSTNIEDTKLKYVIFNVLFIALSSYFRPIFCVFSIFFAYEFLKNYNKQILKYYVLTNIILSLPAIYYVFILDINFFKSSLSNFNIINAITLTYTTVFFYLSPFIIISLKKNDYFNKDLKNIFFTLIFSFFVIIFFDYKFSTGGGFYYYLSQYLLKNNLILFIIFPISFYLCNKILKINKFENFLLFLILLLLEIDGQFYFETYDPLFLIILTTLFNINFKNLFFNQNLKFNIFLVFLFLIFLLSIKIFQNYNTIVIFN
tara:strand:- start:1378 stop:2619 length:1242 start_codon:yes stop_codon:yes gene_type:complete